MASADILRAARARIEDPKNWTTCVPSRDEFGNFCLPDSSSARRWSTYGALLAEGGRVEGPEAGLLRVAALELFGAHGPVGAEEAHGHAAVLQMYDAAIAAAEAEAGR